MAVDLTPRHGASPPSPATARADTMLRAALADLRRGAAVAARRRLEQLLAEGGSTPPAWLLLAQACRALGDPDAEARALMALLDAEPRNLTGLLMLGDLNAAGGDDRGASSFYQMAVGIANGMQVPDQLLPALRKAEAFLVDAQRRYEDHLRARLDEAGAAPERIGGRFAKAVDMLTGRSRPYLQQPSAFYFPELPQRQFFERDEFDWIPAVEAATGAIAAELAPVLATGGDGFSPYIEVQKGRPRSTNPLAGKADWSSLYLWRSGAEMTDTMARFPAATAAMRRAPMAFVPGRGPTALFSLLRPGAHIIPHCGHINTRLICHLPVIVPGDGALRVGNETRAWVSGEMLIFDDSIEHEAWNRSPSNRVVLLFEIWRPELSMEERRALSAMYAAINLYDDVSA